ncbi:MAG: hypothetical protein F6J97_10495 [Leptolyngbya sp. SIO4C1]|nr:hypothetical protein [Leptolyngbya sp. SIO4C1]
MPRLNTSNQVKLRTRRLLEKLISYANYELPESDTFADRLTVRWKREASATPELVVETELKVLLELAFAQQEAPKLKEQLRNDLRVLEEFLNILEDNRARTQGAKDWRFTLKLWDKSTEANLAAFEAAWTQLKQTRRQSTKRVKYTDRLLPQRPIIPEAAAIESTAEPAAASGPQDPPAADRPPAEATAPVCSNLLIHPDSTYRADDANLVRLLALLSFQQPTHLITIEGVGGVGKTTLALEAAQRCLKASQQPERYPDLPQFEAIIFTSAQTQHFSGPQLFPRLGHQRNLQDIFRTISRTLDRPSELPPNFDEQLVLIRDSLSQQKTLLIVDNLETLEDRDFVLSFLREIPPTVKVIVTSRVRLGTGHTLPLEPLSADSGMAFIQAQAQAQAIHLTSAQLERLYRQTGGLPLAIVYSLGMISAYGISPDALDATQLTHSDFARHCFETSVQRLRGQAAHALLMAFACFRHPALPESLAHVAFPSDYMRPDRQPFNELYRLSLVETQQTRYTMHSLTREYAQTELDKQPGFEREARNRWIEWYLEFLAVHGNEDWYDWHPASPIEAEWENLREVVEWCQAQDRYEEFIEFWDYLKGYTQIYGHWNERIAWMRWLIDAAEKRLDSIVMANGMYYYAKTLALFNQPEKTQKAIALCQRIWETAQLEDDQLLIDASILLATLYAQTQDYEKAHHWIDRGYQRLESVPISERYQLYQQVDLPYRKAEICLQQNRLEQAQRLYEDGLEKAVRLGWTRARFYIQGYLGAIAIKQNRLAEAHQLLIEVAEAAEQYKDERCLAICYGHLAELEKLRDSREQAEQWAAKAKASYEKLNMQAQAIRIANLLKTETADEASETVKGSG